jgi:hypothetical protein
MISQKSFEFRFILLLLALPTEEVKMSTQFNVFKRCPDVLEYIEFESPVPLDPSQCSGLNLTVPDFDPVQLPLPKFQTPAVNSAVYVTCDLNVIQAATNGSSISPTVFKRLCVAKNNETDAKFNCNYDIQIHRKITNSDRILSILFRNF